MEVSLQYAQQVHKNLINTSLKRSKGLSLIQLLVTLAISSVILSYAMPELRTLSKLNQNAVIVNRLISDFRFSRNEAIKRMQDVVICKSNDGKFCTTDTQWQSGWIIFVDEVKRDALRSPKEALLKVQQGLGKNIKIKFTSFNRKNKIVYRPSGAAEYSNGTFRFCMNNEKYYKELVLSRMGTTYLKTIKGPIYSDSEYC